MSTLKGKIVWINGAGSGIGLAGAEALAEAGAKVILSGRRADVLAAAARKIKGSEALPLDIAKEAAVAEAHAGIEKRHGAVDILVNSAGANIPKRAFSELTTETWRMMVDANLNGAFFSARIVLPGMRKKKDGLIINIASIAGKRVSQMSGMAYTAAKHAMVAMSEAINQEECRNGIRACAICPGEVATPILDHRPIPPSAEERARMLQPVDLGRIIRFVAETPAHVSIHELLVVPTWNRSVLGGADLKKPL
ncbi:MAG: SDR family oxidoreductase [Alphaproteobacteria bacterium]|nr:SDR family oxidoreductase [Alphaproteobacteria bacterium]